MGRDSGSALSSYGSPASHSQGGRGFALLPTIDFNKLVLPWQILQGEAELARGSQSI